MSQTMNAFVVWSMAYKEIGHYMDILELIT